MGEVLFALDIRSTKQQITVTSIALSTLSVNEILMSDDNDSVFGDAKELDGYMY